MRYGPIAEALLLKQRLAYRIFEAMSYTFSLEWLEDEGQRLFFLGVL